MRDNERRQKQSQSEHLGVQIRSLQAKKDVLDAELESSSTELGVELRSEFGAGLKELEGRLDDLSQRYVGFLDRLSALESAMKPAVVEPSAGVLL